MDLKEPEKLGRLSGSSTLRACGKVSTRVNRNFPFQYRKKRQLLSTFGLLWFLKDLLLYGPAVQSPYYSAALSE